MKINDQNYEAYFLDYAEGQLSATDKAELERFLAENPHLSNELKHFEPIKLMAEDICYENKAELKRTIILQPNDELCISRMEGDLSKADSKKFDQNLQTDAKLKTEYALFLKTKQKPDTTLIYKEKQALRKGGFMVLHRKKVFSVLALAASIALLFWVANQNMRSNTLHPNLTEYQKIENENESTTFVSDTVEDIRAELALLNEPPDEDEKDKKKEAEKKKTQTGTTTITINNGLQKNLHLKKEAEDDKTQNKNTSDNTDNRTTKKLAEVTTPDADTLTERNNDIEIAALEPKLYEQTEYAEYQSLKTVFKNRIYERINPGIDGRIGFDDILSVSFKRLSNITGRKMKVDFKYNEEGKITAFAFTGENIAFSKPLKKNN